MTHPIIAAARHGDLAGVDRLLAEDAGAARFVDSNGWTAAHYAAQLGHLDVLQRLHRCHPEALSAPMTGGAGKHPAHLAAEWKVQSVLRWIGSVDAALLGVADKVGRTALKTLADKKFAGSEESARAWLGLGAKGEQNVASAPLQPVGFSAASRDPPQPREPLHPQRPPPGGGGGGSDPLSAPRWEEERHPVRPLPASPAGHQARALNHSPTERHVETERRSEAPPQATPQSLEQQGQRPPQAASPAAPPAHTAPPQRGGQATAAPVDSTNEYWAEEVELIREALTHAFGEEVCRAMMEKWGLSEDWHELTPLDHESGNGMPLGYAGLSARDRSAVDQLLAANSGMDPDAMELAAHRFTRDCEWEHLGVYEALAFAESDDDGEFVVGKLSEYTARQAPTGGWDPAVLLAAARAQPIQRWGDGSGSVKQILLALYRTLFKAQAGRYMSRRDVEFLDTFGLGDGLFSLSRQKSTKRVDLKEMWTELKEAEGIESESMDKLMGLVGIHKVKEEALAMIKKMLSDRKLTERQRVGTASNFTFMGNPGTGKTCVARLFAGMLKEVGLRQKAQLIETTGQQLVQDGAIKADTVIQGAMDGVLFIDEAHSLDPKGNKAEGGGIVTKLLKAAEDHRDQLTIILAGYQDEIEDRLYGSDPGFRSRFKDVRFEDFSEQELRQIFVEMVESTDWKFHSDHPRLVDVVTARIARGRGSKGFGNAREVRKKLQDAKDAAILAERAPCLRIEDFLGPRPDPKHIPELRLALKKLEDMTGLDEEEDADGDSKQKRGLAAKKAVRQLVLTVQANYDREIRGEKPLPLSLNRLFLGNPGTGKTTVAEILGTIMKQLHLLSNGSVVLKVGNDFIGEHVGGTEEKTLKILEGAMGKVLVIDEAYTLNDANFGKKALDTIVSKVMGSPGEDRAVMMLGYEEPMLQMLRDQNPGLARRFNPQDAFFFPDFDDEQLLKILKGVLKARDLKMGHEVRQRAIELLTEERRKPKFGNAGSVNNLLGRATMAMSARDKDTRTICVEDLGVSARDAGSGGDPLDELKGMFMIEHIVAQLEELRAQIEFKRSRGEEVGVENFLFVGNPGTGKTQVARIMPKLMHALGLLEDRIVETTAMELQAGYVGQSAGKAREKISEASGGVLFVDEAHNFLGTSSFAVEAAKVLMTATLEPEHMGRTMIIFAGYENKMNEMMQSVDPGMRRRFKATIHFPDWTPQNCLDFVLQLCQRQDITVAEDAQRHILEQLEVLHQRPGWGNASDAKDTFEYIQAALAKRICSPVKAAAQPVPSQQPGVIIMQDAVTAMSKFLANRPIREEPQQAVHGAVVGGFAHVDSLSDALPPIKQLVKMVEHRVTESQEAEATDGDGSDDPVFAALQLACVELGYDKDQESRKRLICILEAVQAGESFPDNILEHVKSKTGENETQLQRMLMPQVPPLLQGMMEAVAAEEERLEEIRRLEAEKRAAEAEALRREHREMQRRLQIMGLCPAGFSWYRQGGGWRCHGGTHWVSDAQLR